jgi:hypothetical protein
MTETICYIPVSIGELYDKYTILQIKCEKIKDPYKLEMVNKEIEMLKPQINQYDLDKSLFIMLKQVNTILWDIEDKIRDKERENEFDATFIELARQVYMTNDKRSQIKNQINAIFNSSLSDIKSYTKYLDI